jgi:hypothetical protein
VKNFKKSLLTILFVFLMSNLYAIKIVDTCFDNTLSEDESYSLENLISSIKEVQSPVVTEDYIIFTADKNASVNGLSRCDKALLSVRIRRGAYFVGYRARTRLSLCRI